MKKYIETIYAIIILLACIGIAFADPPLPNWKQITLNTGKVIQVTSITAIDAHSVHWLSDTGCGAVEMADLTPTEQKQVGYDPQAAAKALAAEKAKEAINDAQLEAGEASQRQEKAEEEKRDAIQKQAVTVCGKVLEKVPDGLLVQCPVPAILSGAGMPTKVWDRNEPGWPQHVYGVCLLKNDPDYDQAIDGIQVKIVAYPDSPYSYQETDGSIATISSYTAAAP